MALRAVEKKGGQLNWNCYVLKDGKDIFSLGIPYSNTITIEVPTNVKFPRKFLTLTGMTCKGDKKKNIHARAAFHEQQALFLNTVGQVIPGRHVLFYRGRHIVAHDIIMKRNRLHERVDHIEFGDQGVVMACRNPKSLWPFMSFTARANGKTASYSTLDNPVIQVRYVT